MHHDAPPSHSPLWFWCLFWLWSHHYLSYCHYHKPLAFGDPSWLSPSSPCSRRHYCITTQSLATTWSYTSSMLSHHHIMDNLLAYHYFNPNVAHGMAITFGPYPPLTDVACPPVMHYFSSNPLVWWHGLTLNIRSHSVCDHMLCSLYTKLVLSKPTCSHPIQHICPYTSIN